MNPYRACQQQSTPPWTRIDMLLAGCDGVIEWLEGAVRALARQDRPTAQALLGKSHVMVIELASGINLDVEDPSSINLMRLYEFVTHSIASGDPLKLDASARVMRILREGFSSIRDEAAS